MEESLQQSSQVEVTVPAAHEPKKNETVDVSGPSGEMLEKLTYNYSVRL